MAVNRTGLRHDLAFLRRRLKPAPAAPAGQAPARPAVPASPPAQPSPPAPPGLSLGRPAAPSPGPSAAPRPAAPSAPAPAPASLNLSRPAAPAAGPAPAPPGLSRQPSPAPAPASLNLSRPAAPAAGPAPAPPGLSRQPSPAPAAAVPGAPQAGGRPLLPPLFPAPSTRQLQELTRARPLVRLDPRQSAVGSLRVAGAVSAVWESSERITGALAADGRAAGRTVTTPGNRQLVDFEDGEALIALRHLKEFRRALFIGPDNAPVAVRLYGGASVVLPPEPGHRNVLLVSRIGPVLELRSDPVPSGAPDDALWQAFGFRMSAALPAAGWAG